MIIEEIFDRHRLTLVGAVTAWCGSKDLAEDAVQQAFLAALAQRDMMSNMPEKAGTAWLYVTARNKATDMLRKRQWLILMDEVINDVPDSLRGAEESQLLAEMLERLPEKQREVIAMRYYSGYNSTEIGALLGMTAATVRYHLAKAIKQLREYYKEEAT